ncbi:MAG: 3-phosphoshikimate 1-carboxyvinyltransferase [Bauldia litoralis]
MTPLTAAPSRALTGTVRPPGDKSISHRALMFGALAVGETRIDGLLEGADVLATAAALRQLGAEIEREPGDTAAWRVWGRGVGGLRTPDDVLDMGNSGTAARLLLGLLATQDIRAFVTGDASLRRRPMGRVIDPLTRMGAQFEAREGGRLPLMMTGCAEPIPVVYRPPVASAQVKSAILLAGLNAPGETAVIEAAPTRDHTERMMRHFGATVRIEETVEGRVAAVRGWPELTARPVSVPADPSSAAFPIVAALIAEGSEVTATGVGLNPLRAGLFETLREMGADLAYENEREEAGEPVADLRARASALAGVRVPAARAPAMIDEYPILAAAAALAKGTTRYEGVGELRVKESDRLAAVADGLAACGVTVRQGEDWLEIDGTGGAPVRGTEPGAAVATQMDHRIAMSFLVLGLASADGVSVDDGTFIETSFPGFAEMMGGLGATIATGGKAP